MHVQPDQLRNARQQDRGYSEVTTRPRLQAGSQPCGPAPIMERLMWSQGRRHVIMGQAIHRQHLPLGGLLDEYGWWCPWYSSKKAQVLSGTETCLRLDLQWLPKSIFDGKLDTKASLQKTAPPAPSASSAEPVRGAAQCWKCPFWGLAWSPRHWPGSLGGPPPSWGTQQRLSVPPGHRGRGPCSSPILVEVQCQDPFSPRSWDTTASFGYSLLERLL